MKRTIDPKLIGLLGRGLIHPALHADERGIVVARFTERGTPELVTSDRHRFAPTKKMPIQFRPYAYQKLAARWSDDDLADFLAHGAAPTFGEVLALVIHAFDQVMEFASDTARSLVAVWSVATYFYLFFLAFPRLAISGEKGSGKSKLLSGLAAISFNGLYILGPTPAVLYRLIHTFRPTLLLDEMEKLSKDDLPELLAIINAGYKVGGSVPRCEGEGIKRVVDFDVYGPMAFAAIRSANVVTEDRAIPLVLQKGRDSKLINAEVDPRAPLYARIRAASYRLLLTRWRDVAEAVAAFQCPAEINARARELWRPMLVIARLADRDGELGLEQDLLQLALEHIADRDSVSAEGEALLVELQARLGDAADIVVRPKDLSHDLQVRLGWERPPSPEAVAAWLRRYGFPRAKPPKDREGARYTITREQLCSALSRYTPHLTVTPSPSHANPTNS